MAESGSHLYAAADPQRARLIIHVDMDAFFAAVEQRDDPALRGQPVLVGGLHRGVVAAASYEARRFGIHSAMPMHQARRRCPQARVVAGRIDHYRQVSARVFAIFRRFTPQVEGLSLDEAFLDVTGSTALFGDGRDIAGAIRASIQRELGLTASAAVAPSKFVAKIASETCKPDGLRVIRAAEVEAFLAPLPVARMWGVGPAAAATLARAGVHTLGALRGASAELLARIWGRRGAEVAALAGGLDRREVEPNRVAKSVGAERTLPANLTAAAPIATVLLALALELAARLWQRPACGRSLTLKLKYADFQLRCRQRTLAEPICDADALYDNARALLALVPDLGRGVRLVGMSVGALQPGLPPRGLFTDPRRERALALEAVRARATARFGAGILGRASLCRPEPVSKPRTEPGR